MKKKDIKGEILPAKFEVKQLVGLSWKALNNLWVSLQDRPLTVEDIPKWKLVLGFTNSTNNSIKTSMQCFRLSNLPQAIKQLKKAVKERKY